MHLTNNSLWECKMFEDMINMVVQIAITTIEVGIMIEMDIKEESHTKDTTMERDMKTEKENPIINSIDTMTKVDPVEVEVMVDFTLQGLRYL